jgi:ribosomal protein S18 acetylase RimI-like enzyme
MSAVTVEHAATAVQIQQVRDLLREYTDWAFASTTGSVGAPTFEGLEEELAGLPGIFAPPDGRLLLAAVDGQPAGCIALRRHDDQTGEIKRLYVRPGFRGHNLGGRLVAALLDAARAIGYRRLVLDSHHTMTHAHALYRTAGFRVVEAPDDFPEDLRPIAVFMEMDLAPGA